MSFITTNPNTPSVPYRFNNYKNPFAIPAGRYRAAVKWVKMCESKTDKSKQAVKFLFDVIENVDGPVAYMISKEYAEGSAEYAHLAVDLEAFLDKTEIEEFSKNKAQIDLADLEGKHVDLMINTISSPKYDTPYSFIDGIFPAGYLIPQKKRESNHGDACMEMFAAL